MSELLGSRVEPQCPTVVAFLFQQYTEVERAVGIPALGGAAEGSRGAQQISFLFEQHTEI